MTLLNSLTEDQIKNLSLEEIESLMEELGTAETFETCPLTLEERVTETCTETKEAIKMELDAESETEKKLKFFDIALNTVLSHRVDDSEVKAQIKRVINSSRSRGVVQTSSYFSKFRTDKEARDIGKVVFAALRKYNKALKISTVKSSAVKDSLREARRVQSPIAKEVLGDFKLLNMI
jgi:hypothetical protein